MTTKFTRRRSSSTRESLTMIPELPSIEDHYNEDSSDMVLTPRTRNTATISRSAIQRQQRRAIVLQAIDNAIKILQMDDSSRELDLDDSTSTSCTAPLTDEEPSNSAHSSNSFVSPETTPDSPLLRGNRRWTASAQQSPNTPTSNTKKKRRGGRKKTKDETPDSAPKLPVRQQVLSAPPLA